MPRVKLTAKGVEALQPNGAPQTDYWDALMPGLLLRVGTTSKVWYVRYRVNGTQRRHKLGRFPRLSLADARDQARDVLVRADAGEDPAADKAVRRTGARTFRALAEEVIAGRKARVRAVTLDEYDRLLKRDVLPAWGDREAASITRREVVQLVESVAERAPTVGNRVLAVVGIVFNDGLRRGFPGLESNPAHLVEPPTVETARERYLTADELRAVWKATDPENPMTQAAVRLAFLTAQRIGSILRMKWADINGDVWTIPAADFKGNRPHLVPLSAEAKAIIDALRDPAPLDDAWVFPSREAAKLPHLSNMGKAATRIRKASAIPHWTLHDARTTYRTHSVRAVEDGGLGVSSLHADAVLGHKETTMGAEHYTGDKLRYMLHEKRTALRKWGAFVGKAVAN